MTALWATTARELRAYFLSPIAYFVAAFLLLVNGVAFTLIVSYLNEPGVPASLSPLSFFFGGTFFFWLVLLFVTPVLTMRLISEERRSGRIESLMTAPITEAQVVVGKFLAAFLFYLFIWLPTVSYPLILSYYSDVDWGPVLSGYLGVFGIGAFFLAIGMLGTSLARSQLMAAVVTFAVLVPLFTVGFLQGLLQIDFLSYLDFGQHMDGLGKGVVDTRHLVYYSSGTALFLALATWALAARKWR